MMLKLEFNSSFDMLEFVDAASGHMTRLVGLDEDSQEQVGLAIRESVINAIKHGNGGDARKRVFVEFAAERIEDAMQLAIRVRDEGHGFNPDTLADPLAPENLLKSSGRGILLIRSFMDDVRLGSAPEGGMEIRMTKRVSLSGADNPGLSVRT